MRLVTIVAAQTAFVVSFRLTGPSIETPNSTPSSTPRRCCSRKRSCRTPGSATPDENDPSPITSSHRRRQELGTGWAVKWRASCAAILATPTFQRV